MTEHANGWLTTEQAATFLNRTPSHVRRWAAAGRLKGEKGPDGWRLNPASVNAYQDWLQTSRWPSNVSDEEFKALFPVTENKELIARWHCSVAGLQARARRLEIRKSPEHLAAMQRQRAQRPRRLREGA